MIMRLYTTIALLCISIMSFGQIEPGFDTKEVTYTIAMCNSFNFLKQYGTNDEIIPESFNLNYTSDILSMDNKFEVYENGDVGVINYRGSTDKVISWVENFYSAMIPAEGTIVIQEEAHDYRFAKAEDASIHAGYGLTVVILSEKIKEQIAALNQKGIYNIIITGHSQGGALATMTRAYLENLPKGELSSKNTYKTYAFAQPMCGNKEFANEYNERFSDEGTSYSIINPEDPVPYLPFNYEEDKLVTKEKVASWIFGKKEFKAKKFGQDALVRLFERRLKSHVKNTNALINKMIGLKFGKVEMPEFVEDINYYPTGDIKEIAPFEYPKIEADVTGLTEKELKNYEQGADGKWYKKETKFFQHKPYNYYVGVLKAWDDREFRSLNKMYLISDL